MNCPICDKEIQDGLRRHDSSSGTMWFDENNIIRHRDLSSEQASEMSAKGKLSPPGKKQAAELAQAAIEVLIDEDDPRSESLKILITQLSKSASKDSTSALKAIELMLSLLGESSKIQAPGEGQKCPTCKETKGGQKRDSYGKHLKTGTRSHVQHLLEQLLEE